MTPDQKVNSVLFSIRMEEALCRLLSDDRLQIRLASNLYKNITRQYQEFPAGWFRLGQACARIAEDAEPGSSEAETNAIQAFKAYEEARLRLKKTDNLPETDKYFRISPGQEAYLKDNSARLQGFVIWRNSDRRRQVKPPSTKDVEDVAKAYNITLAGFHEAQTDLSRIKVANNSAYYAVEAMVLANKLGSAAKVDLTSKLFGEILDLLERYYLQESMPNILILDTIARAREFLGDTEGARRAATRVLDANTERADRVPEARENAYQREMYGRAVQYAWGIVRNVVT